MKILLKAFFIFLIVSVVFAGGLLVWGVIAGLMSDQGAASQNSETSSLTQGFAEDRDNDGLSDAKEQIFGSDKENPDTDGDTFRDGSEVENGYDPTVAGSARIEDSPAYATNLTWQYFEWGREKRGEKDPALEEAKVEQFLEEQGMARFTPQAVEDSEITATEDASSGALAKYLEGLALIKLPEETGSFTDLAQEVIHTKKTEVLDKVIAGLADTKKQFTALAAPPDAREVHKGYVSMLNALTTLFNDLYGIDRDPVKLMRDIRWGNELIVFAVEIETQRALLIEKAAQTQ